MSPVDPTAYEADVAEDRDVARLLQDYVHLHAVVLNLDPLTLPGARWLSPAGRDALLTATALYRASADTESAS